MNIMVDEKPYSYFRPKPKPSRKSRLKQEKMEHQLLIEYRKAQSALAILRDRNQCVICARVHNRKRNRAHIHHVYGRGDCEGHWRENYKSLMCLCVECHNSVKAIYRPGESANFGWVEDVLKGANDRPLSPSFVHEPDLRKPRC